MKRNTLVFVIIAIAAFFMIFNPVKACQDRNPTVRLPSQDEKRLASLVAFATNAWASPIAAVIRSFGAHDVVVLGE
jgi:hypothetical protein